MITKNAGHGHENQLSAIRGPDLVGRRRELNTLTEVLVGPPVIVLIEGEAGIGKTRLVHEFLAAEVEELVHADRAVRALVANCPAFHEPQTLGPIVDAVRQAAGRRVDGLRLTGLAGALRPLFPEWAEDLPRSPEPLADPTASRHRIFRALAEVLSCLQVTLLVLEDAHWADEPTLEFLLFLATLRPGEVSLVVTYRPEDVPATSLVWQLSRLAGASANARMTLDPLDVDATARMVSSMIGDEPVSAEFAAFLHRHTDGVPFVIEESVRLLAERADLKVRRGRWSRHKIRDITVPPTVREAVLERAARLMPEARAVLRAAAVLADPADMQTLLAVSALSTAEFNDGLMEALGCRLVGENRDGFVQFRHVIAARAIYEEIPLPERRELHRRAGRVLEGKRPQPFARLNRHFREAGETAAWCQYGEEAAGLASATGDEATAAAVLHDLIVRAGLSPGDMARLTSKIPMPTLSGTGQLATLASALRSALDTGIALTDERASVRCQLGRVLTALGDWDAAHVELQQALPDLTYDPVALTRTLILLGWPLGTSLPAARHRRWLRRAVAVPEGAGAVDRLLMSANRTIALLLLGDSEGWIEAARLPTDAPTAQERLEVARGHVNLGEAAIAWGRYADAAQSVELGRRMADSHHYPWLKYSAAVDALKLDWLLGAWPGLAERARSLSEDLDVPQVLQLRAALVTELLKAASGPRAGTVEDLRRLIEETRRLTIAEYRIEPAALLGRIHLARAEIGDAVRVTDEPSELVVRRGIWIWATELAPTRVSALLAADRSDDAADFLRAFIEGWRNSNAPAPNAALVLSRALFTEAQGKHSRAAALFARAALAWDRLPRPHDASLARERQAGSLIASGQVGEGTALLSQVRQELIDLGAVNDAERVVSTLREYGVLAKRPQRGGWAPYGDQLSPRELDVARLVVAGHTNREIATALSRSPKTVATQLNSAMRKLAVSTRTALAVRVVEAGLVELGRQVPGTSQD